MAIANKLNDFAPTDCGVFGRELFSESDFFYRNMSCNYSIIFKCAEQQTFKQGGFSISNRPDHSFNPHLSSFPNTVFTVHDYIHPYIYEIG
jgi:hypothetical protein